VAVDDEHGALGHACVSFDVVTPHAERGDERPLEVADELEGQAAQLGRERLMGEDGVDAYPVDADARGDRLVVP
jgi:hypothetical protein